MENFGETSLISHFLLAFKNHFPGFHQDEIHYIFLPRCFTQPMIAPIHCAIT